MIIREAIPRLVRIPLKTPYTIAHHTFEDVEMVFLEIRLDNGLVGYGSASPAEEVVGETAAAVYSLLPSVLEETVTGKDVRDFMQIIADTKRVCPDSPGTLAAIDIALHDAYCRFRNIPLVELFGRSVSDLPTSVTIGIMKEDDAIEHALEYMQMGFRALKIKTGMDVDADISLLQRLRSTLGERILLRVDANRGYNLSQLRRFMEGTKSLQLELVEQPLLETQDEELLSLPEQWRKQLMADESLHDWKAAALLVQDPQPFGIFNIKLMKCGGIAEAIHMAKIANSGQIPVFWGCNDESVCSIAAALHTAYSQPNTAFLDLDGSFELANDLLKGGFRLDDGMMQITGLPGLGVHTDSDS